jgi:kynurenine formamidase
MATLQNSNGLSQGGLPVTKRIIDLSVKVEHGTKGPPSMGSQVEIIPSKRGPGHWQASAIKATIHTGSHVDSPRHVVAGAPLMAEFPLDTVIGTAVVFNLPETPAHHGITIEELKACGVEVKRGDIVLVRSDWSDRTWGTPAYFTDSPWLTPEAAAWLVSFGPKAIGFDFSEEYIAGRRADFTSDDFVTHKAILGKGVIIMEGITNLGALPSTRVEFFAPFYKIAAEGAFARFFAIVED